MTAAHCFPSAVQRSIKAGTYFMRLGVSDLEDETAGVRRKVVKSFTHPKYVSPPYFDVGVAEADEVIEFVNKVRPICLPMRPIDDYDAFVGKLLFQ